VLLAGKPEVLLRILVAAIAAAVLFFGVWLASNIAVTFDQLKNPYIAAIYGVVLLCFFTGVGIVAWLRLRRLSSASAAKLVRHQPVPETPLPDAVVTKRADQISRQWQRGGGRPVPLEKSKPLPPAAPAEPKSHGQPPARALLIVTGPAYAGKTALIARLAQATSADAAADADASDTVRLLDAGPVDGEEGHLADIVANAATSDGVLFVVDQDLRAPEVAAIARLMAAKKPLYVVLNKADQFNASDRDAILLSIRNKMPKGFAAGNVVSVAVSPSPVEREIEDARGAVRVELRRPSADLRALTNLLGRNFPPAAGRTLRFEAAA
jgi:signal recognition particle receptor subunit beta